MMTLSTTTSAAHAARVTPRHPGDPRLAEIADAAPFPGAPAGDVLPSPNGDGTVGTAHPTPAALGRPQVGPAVRQLKAAGEVPPIYLSANVPGGDEHNPTLESRPAASRHGA